MIVGGGLVGSLLAVVLAERGRPVTVFERRADPRRGGAEGGRSINLVLTRRGVRALERVGLATRAMALTVPVTGRMMHAVDGERAYQPYGRDASECNLSISRAGLNAFLLDAAVERGVDVRFGARLVGADAGRGRLSFEDDASARFEIEARVVFGADGAGSALRGALRDAGTVEESVDMLPHGYKELEIPPDDRGAFRIEAHALHIWPRGSFMLMALPNVDGSFTATLYLPYQGARGFDRLADPDGVRALFRSAFPDAIALMPDLERAFFANPTGSLGTVRCRPWRVGGRALLIGDAAHAIVPFFGQGMNTGFEDCSVLADLLDARGNDFDAVFAEFERRRKPDADAIADMALENFVEMRDRVADDRFLLRKAVEHRLEVEMPRSYRSRYSMVMYSHIPFAVAREAGRVQEGILDDLCAGIESPDALDVERARRLVDTRLTPLLRARNVRLDY